MLVGINRILELSLVAENEIKAIVITMHYCYIRCIKYLKRRFVEILYIIIR